MTAPPPLRPSSPSVALGRRLRRCVSAWVALAALLVVVVLSGGPAPAGASDVVEAQGIALDISTTCTRGNVNITYAANGVQRQVVEFTSEDGRVLDLFDSEAYDPNYEGTEYILTMAGSTRGGNQPVPPRGTRLGVYVTLGVSPPTAANGEFFLLYRCDDQRNDRGGDNEVLSTCVGDYGTCPRTAREAIDASTTTVPPTTGGAGPTTSVTEPPRGSGGGTAPPARPVSAQPRFTG